MIPIFLIARDRLTCLKSMVEYLVSLKDARVFILDNASTYPPLLAWYKTAPCEVIYVGGNGGPRIGYRYAAKINSDYYVISDPDLGLEGVPVDVLDFLRKGLETHRDVCKAGLGLRIDDLSSALPFSKQIIQHETPFWTDRRDASWWNAGVDTTFAMYRGGGKIAGLCIRADYPYVCRHLSWYLDFNHLPEDERYYLRFLKPNSSHWSREARPLAGIFIRERPHAR